MVAVRKLALLVSLALIGLMAACGQTPAASEAIPSTDPSLLWGVQEGFALEKVTGGFQFPVDIVFVPEPGPSSDDVRFYVAELYGAIKAVTNDGDVVVFADDFTNLELPTSKFEEYGIGGLCLAPEEGYMFVVWNEPYDGYQRFNYITRFRVTPGVFGTQPIEHQSDIGAGFFERLHVGSNHQVGSCQVVDDLLYLSVGDGFHPEYAQDPASFFGKILRMDLDLNPAPGNPFPPSDDPADYRGYVWAMGFRNPFALHLFPDGRAFVGDNGPEVDRFVAVNGGENLGYDGSNTSIGVNAIFSFFPAIGPSRLDYVPESFAVYPQEYRDRFYLSGVGTMYGSGDTRTRPGILRLDVDQDLERGRSVPDYLVRYMGDTPQGLVALALGEEGLYFAPLIPENDTGSWIYRIVYDPARAHATGIGQEEISGGLHLIATLGCNACHPLVGLEGNLGPSLDRIYLYQRLDDHTSSPEYLDALNALDQRTEDFWVETRPARAAVRVAAPGDERVRVWFYNHLKYTGFDNPASQMPNLDLTDHDIERIADFLLYEPGVFTNIRERILRIYPVVSHSDIGIALAVGVLLGIGTGWLGSGWLQRQRNRNCE